MADKIFIDGLRFFPKRDNAPEFVIGSLILTPYDIAYWAKSNPQYMTDYNGKQQVKIQITKGQSGKLVFAVDTWKPDGTTKPAASKGNNVTPDDVWDSTADPLPF